MFDKKIITALTLLVVLVLFSVSSADDFLIYDPCESTSAAELYQLLQGEQYTGIITDDVLSHLENLDDYNVLFVIGDYFCDGFDLDLVNQISGDVYNFLVQGGSIYWQGENTVSCSDEFRDNIFQFDIATCATNPSEQLWGCSQSPFNVEVSTDIIYAEMIVGGDGAAFEGEDICWCKGIYRQSPFKAVLTTFPFSSITDNGANTRVEFVNEIMIWLLPQMDITDPSIKLPENIAVIEAYPNPFNAQTQISCSINTPSTIQIVVYNILGQPVETIYNNYQLAGEFKAIWNAENYSTGVYFVRLESEYFTECVKLILLK